MKRKIVVDVKNRAELEALKLALALPDVRAFVLICGYLEPFEQTTRNRILKFVADKVTDDVKRR